MGVSFARRVESFDDDSTRAPETQPGGGPRGVLGWAPPLVRSARQGGGSGARIREPRAARRQLLFPPLPVAPY
eukprot:5631403-Pyramimonas_sp.AAC.1